MARLRRFGCIFAAASVICSCSNPDKRTCLDMVDIFTAALVECGQAEEQVRIQLMGSFDGCNVVGIRDEEELRNVCFPWMSDTATCDELISGPLHPSCNQQLLIAQ